MRKRIALGVLFAFLGAFPLAAEDDLSVAWIARLPRIAYVWKSTNPRVEGWPSPGQTVTWVAHVRNLSGRQLTGIGYRWSNDDTVVKEGTATLAAEGTTTFELPWEWTFTRHEIAFEIDPADKFVEALERNNRLRIFTDAIGVGIWVERGFWEGIRPAVRNAAIGAATFDDWVQRRVNQYNDLARLAIYPETPQGVLDRWRIDEIHLVEDGALPIVPPGADVRDWGAGTASWGVLYPDSSDRTIDIQWGFPTSSLSAYANRDAWTLLYDSFVHEMGHARYLVDVYGWDLDLTHDLIEMNPKPPATGFGVLHSTPDYGLMNTSWGFIDRYSAVALNRIAGFRATEGTYNEPWNLGVFLNDLPLQNRIRLVTPDGRTFPRREVRIYKAGSAIDPDWKSHSYQIHIDGTPDLVLQTDDEGAALVGRNPIADGDLSILVDRCNVVSIVEVIDGETHHFGYLESRILNYAYWRGETTFAEHDVLVDAPICPGLGVGANIVKPAHETLLRSPDVTFEFTSDLDHNYEIWVSVDGNKPVRREAVITRIGGGVRVRANMTIYGKRVAWWYVDRTPNVDSICALRRSSTYFFDMDVPAKAPKRRAVGR